MEPEPSASLLIRAEASYHDVIADPRRGRKIAESVAERARRAGATEARVVALRAAGWAARELYDHGAARSHLDEAIRTARRAQLHERLCEALITRSAAYLELGRTGRARQDLAAAHAAASDRTRPEVAIATGLLEDKAGNFATAASAFRSALAELGDDRPELRVKALNNLALNLVRFGHHEEAERLLAEALDLAATFSKAFAGFVTESQAIVAVAGGRPVDALRRYERAEDLLTAVGAQLVDLYLGKARALLTVRLLDEAAEAAERAVRQVDGLAGGSLMLAEALLPQAQIALARNRLDEAATIAARAESLFRNQRRSGWRVTAALLKLSAQTRAGPTAAMPVQLDRIERTMREIGNMPGAIESAMLQGEVSAALGQPRRAMAAFARAAQAGARGPALLRIQGRRAAARHAELGGDVRRLALQCRLGLDELAAYRATIASTELRARAAGHGSALAEIGLRAALRSGRPEQIWSWLERARSVIYVRHAERPDAQLRPLLAELRALKSWFDELPPDAGAERTRLLRTVAALEDRIRTASWTRRGPAGAPAAPGVKSWHAPSVRALRALRGDLGDRALLQYGVRDGQMVAVAVTRERITFAELGGLDKAIGSGQQLAFALRRLCRPRSRSAAAAAFDSAQDELRRLSAMLLAPLEPAFADAGEVIVSPVGALIGVPWSALSQLADRSVRIVPSAMAWWQGRGQEPASDRVVLVAGPGLESPDDEINQISRRYRTAVRLSGHAATTETVQQHASGAKVVHIASHGRLRADSPTFSSLELADGPLTVHDLECLEAPAHHWVLAACDLGHPGALAGPALEGVLATLLSSGAGAVIAAVVSVPDLSTRDLMVALHDCLAAGVPMPESLRRARRTLDMTDPAGFVASTAFACYGGG